ncbi:MBL fold metallo-hydrolase [Clostridium sp. Cult3]|uniref:MBL fold metallo-hydrolase n=1 Tax=Clostridium sp. Cult3 TaxID=2079004 RepID=UPI001F3377AB|nr:MBL fold metallo-hydrolase [Clostridium sp. Cult3]MCF6461336.1 MBL fold metallo-hydrolase [Clostridium sp. Cult3]
MRNRKIKHYLILALVIAVMLTGCEFETTNVDRHYDTELVVHFIDVGQGDSTFIQFPNGDTSLIDGGTRNNGEKVVKYLKDLKIDRIDYLIATHPHEDHIGGLPDVIRNFDIGKVYMPERTANTLIFEELLEAIKAKGLKVNIAKGADAIIDEADINFLILAPNRNDYDKTNDFSIVTKVNYGSTSFIIAGDAEKESEMDILKGGYDLKADVLRIGHHGGKTSSIDEFLEAVKADCFVISVGSDNSYGHPHRETMDRISKINSNSNILRTDKLGDIIIRSNGKELVLDDAIVTEDVNEVKYIGNKNTKVFHTIDCKSLPNKENQIIFKSMDEAINSGYRPHEKCVK